MFAIYSVPRQPSQPVGGADGLPYGPFEAVLGTVAAALSWLLLEWTQKL